MNQRRRSTSGFTLVELLISLAIMAVLMLIAVGPLSTFIHRGKIEGMARETATLMQLARFEAIKRNVPARVVADETRDVVFAYADLNGDTAFDPVVDREIGRFELPRGVVFRATVGVEDDNNAMWNMLGPPTAEYAEFRPDGSVTRNPSPEAGTDGLPSIRLADRRQNYLEVKIATAASGRVELRKWQEGAYRVQGENDKPWEWF
jgi:prepilin-type N-terminal cleavage/methylation domain-containing protein